MSKLDVTAERLLERVTPEWQPLEPIIDDLIPMVAPGVAMRRYLARRDAQTRRKGAEPTRHLTDRQMQESGARSIIADRIQSHRNGGRIETKVEDGVRYVRLKAENGCCPTCQRPFPSATVDTKPQPSSHPKPRPQKVVYPKFPQWERKTAQVAGGSE